MQRKHTFEKLKKLYKKRRVFVWSKIARAKLTKTWGNIKMTFLSPRVYPDVWPMYDVWIRSLGTIFGGLRMYAGIVDT